ncbi:ABC transporter permease [Bariatricus sp. SGI.154]|uniref:ABC transporter permease n=1 Tax=Bariatricus sp. SGI.154 TaxID=3420549 RepID=UPI003D0489CC
MEKFETVVKPKTGWFDINIKEVWQYRDLITLFVHRNFVSQYKQTILGPAWAIIQPLLTTVVFTVVFGSLAGLAADGVPSFLFYLSGTVVWTYFSTCLTQTADTFTGNAGILGKVYFPRIVMPISTVMTNLISFAIQFAMFIMLLIIYCVKGAVHPNAYMLFLPLLVIQMAMLGLGTGVIVSALTTKYRDLKMLVSFGVQLWMYATPVTYDINIIPQKYMGLYMLNPMTSIINIFRQAFLGIGNIEISYYLISWGVTLVILFIGVIMFNRVEKTFMDTV